MPAIEQCPHRDDVQIVEGLETCHCQLLSRIIGGERELTSLRVPRSACAACVDGIAPSVNRLNSVLASFVYSAAAQILEQGGTSACDAAKAEELQEWATSSLQVDASQGRPLVSRPRLHTDCCHLGPVIGHEQQPSIVGLTRTPVYTCHHPAHRQTTADHCRACHDWTLHPDRRNFELAEILPSPPEWTCSGPECWAVGMTTAPRRTPTLEASLDYLRRAGWDELHLGVDGSTSLPAESSVEQISVRTPGIGAWPNFYLTMLELVLKQPEADAVLMLQDDVQFYDGENVRQYLESILWPSDPPGIVSLYCSAAYTREEFGWTIADETWEWGALAFVFPMELARRFLSDRRVIEHRQSRRGLRFIDDVIGEWTQRESIPIWYPTPSLVQHLGETSTIWTGEPAAGYRRADRFVGDL